MRIKQGCFLISCWLALCLAGTFSPTASAQDVKLEGGFVPATPVVGGRGTSRLLRQTQLWDSWEGDDHRTGRLTYGPFVPSAIIELYVAGYPIDENKEIYLESVQTGERLVLRPRTAPGNWTRLRWSLPPSWVGHAMRLVAVDRATDAGGWLGISAPLKPSWRLGPALSAAGLQAAVFMLLLLPGLAFILMRPATDPLRMLAWMLTASALASYAIFFVYLASPAAGHRLSWGILGGSLVCVAAFWRKIFARMYCVEFIAPIALALTAATFYFVGGLLYGGMETPGAVSFDRFLPSLPPDPLLPHWFAEKLAKGEPLRPFFSDWLTSDRPPLQVGLNLLFWPLIPHELGYVAVGVAAQCWVWIGLWIFLRRFRVCGLGATTVLAGAIFSGFFFLNSFFCWPKLLPTTFLLMLAGFLWGRPRQEPLTFTDGFFAGSSAAFSLLGHGGSIFGLAGITIVYLLERRALTWRALALGALVAGMIMLPWQWYQKYCDPPGDRLVKYHLAGHESIDPRSSWAVIREAYGRLGKREIFDNKLANLRMLFWGNGHVTENLAGTLTELRQGEFAIAFWHASRCLREAGFFHYFQMLGPMLLGLPGLIWLRWRRHQHAEWLAARTGMALSLATALVWCALMFKGGSTVIHQGSYFLGACLYTSLGLGFIAYTRGFRLLALGVNFLWFLWVWMLSPLHNGDQNILLPASYPGFWCMGGVLGAGLIACLLWLEKSSGLQSK